MFKLSRYTAFSGKTVVLLAAMGAGVAMASGQTAAAAQSDATPLPTLDLSIPSAATLSQPAMSASVAEGPDAPTEVASLHPTVVDFAEAMQYGGGQRRRYGRTRYRGAHTNADGSNKYIFFGGVGLVQPTGNTFHYLTPSYGIEVGGGLQFNKHVALPIQFDYDHFGMAGETLQNQEAIYNYAYGSGSAAGLDGNSHVWSFSVDPMYTIRADQGLGAYVVAGVGFYHKVANFTLPTEEEECYYYCETFVQNENVDHYTSNAPGFSGGIGLTYKFSKFSGERFFVEARYVFVDNSQRAGVTVNNLTTAPSTSTDFYPANSNRTTYVPIKAGLRF